ncbi:hypothetical protein [Streptomyces sp. STR69]|uniref:hypothetical protein n=1 Tax=Streptomyces sp. STR69 TaxID=1796942 RepID=UPI0021C6E571|nr:hypothetical protein [Streptomyces sp. STR69]
MRVTLHGRGTRTIAAGALSLALLSAGTASAFAASPSPKASPSAMGSITVKADKSTVKNGSSYSLTAKLNTKGQEHLRIAAGTTYSPTVTVKVT